MSNHKWQVSPCFFVLLIGCSQSAVEKEPVAWHEGSQVAISTEPILTIGAVDGDEEYEFGHIVGAFMTEDGQIVVADGLNNVMRFFDRRGRHIQSVGRHGGGPGEWQSLDGIFRGPADSVTTFDLETQRITVWTRDGTFARSTSFSMSDGRFLVPIDMMPDGTMIFRGHTAFSPMGPPGIHEIEIPLFRSGDTSIAPLNVTLTDRQFRGANGLFQTEFSLRVFIAAGDSLVLTGVNDVPMIDVYGLTGELKATLEIPIVAEPLSEDQIQSYKQTRIERTTAAFQRSVELKLEQFPFPQFKPLYKDLFIDHFGNIWIELFSHALDEPGWIVLNRDGVELDRLNMPVDLDVFQIGADFMLGRYRDELGVQYVRVHELRR